MEFPQYDGVPQSGGDAGASFDEQAARLQRDLVEYQQAQADYNEKMAALQLYVQKYGARIDVRHRNKNAPNTEVPNLGTAVPSWYYLDGRGNKIFVQDMSFDNALALSRGGAGMNVRDAHGYEQQEVVVVVPRAKRNPAWHAEYLRRTEEYDAARRRLPPNAGRVALREGSRLIGDGIATQHQLAYGSIGRKQGGGALWEARQAQARILGSRSAQRRPATAGAIASRPYDAPQLLTASADSNASNGVIAAIMVPEQQQQQQQYYFDAVAAHPHASVSFADQQQGTAQDAAALQEEARRLLEQLGGPK